MVESLLNCKNDEDDNTIETLKFALSTEVIGKQLVDIYNRSK